MIFLSALLFGLLLGSFANVYFYRLPRDLSLWQPRSFCPACGRTLPWWENIPLLSFLLQRGLCRGCGARIPRRYPLVELALSLLFLALAVRLRGEPPPVIGGLLFFTLILFLVAGIDWVTFLDSGREYGIIPDPLLLWLAGTGFLFIPLNPFVGRSFPAALLAAPAAGILMLAFRWGGEKLFKREALGLGDVKMMAAVALWLGWKGTLFTLIAGSLIGTLVSLVLISLRRTEWRAAVPFGPFLSLGAYLALFYF